MILVWNLIDKLKLEVLKMTIVEDSQKGMITDEMKIVAKNEGLDPEFIRRGIAAGRIVIPTSPYREVKICGIGEGLMTKVNASIGVSSDIVDVDMEIKKAQAAEAAGADTLMELGTGGDFLAIRKKKIMSAKQNPQMQMISMKIVVKYFGWILQ